MKIKELSDKTGINLETIRYYEKIGLLPAPHRTANSYRFYSNDTVNLLNFIKKCRSLGFSIEETRQLNTLKATPENHTVADQIIQQQLQQVNEKIEQLYEIKAFLQILVIQEAHTHEECQVLSGLELLTVK